MKKDINEILTTKKQKYLVGVTILLLLVAVGLFSYAFTGNINYVGLNTNQISNCSIDLSFKETNPIRLADSFPMNYEKVQEYEPYTFYIKNNSTSCDILTYKIDMASICDTCETESCDLGDGNTCNCNEDYKLDETLINYELKNVITGEIIRGTINEFHIEKILDENTTDTYEMRMWIDESATQSDVYVNGDNKLSKNYCGKLNVEVIADKLECDPMPVEESNANAPVLASNMIPVCYNSEKDMWLKADSTNADTKRQWYSYSGKTWANAVTVTEENRDTYLNAEVGTPISMDDINTMLVWIPRFNVIGDEENYNGGTKKAPGAFDITFVNKETNAHDAFTFGDEVSGLWIGKFENSSDTTCTPANGSAVGSGCNLNTIRPKILPNATSWQGAMVSTFFYDIQKMTLSGNQYGFDKAVDTSIDTHMAKNNEWAAALYLSNSIYGRCISSTECVEVSENNHDESSSSSTMTGYGNNSTASYNTSLGMDASTTGNIYGVYDMHGGANESVMGVYWDGTKKWSGATVDLNSGFNGWLNSDSTNYVSGVAYPNDDKYYNLYTTKEDYTNVGLQHAMNDFYDGVIFFPTENSPWIYRYYFGIAIIMHGIGETGEGNAVNGGFTYRHISSRTIVTIN